MPFLRPKNQKNGARFKRVTSGRTAIRPFKIAVLNLETCIQACSTVLIDPIFFVLRVGVDNLVSLCKEYLRITIPKRTPYLRTEQPIQRT